VVIKTSTCAHIQAGAAEKRAIVKLINSNTVLTYLFYGAGYYFKS
jgi:hypothetical protein